MATIPVFGMTILPELATVRANYQGVMYFFCSAHCHVKFTTPTGAVFAFRYNHHASLFGKRES